MKLWEAMKLLEEGNKVRRVNWEKDVYVYKGDDGEYYKSNGEDFDIIYLDNTNEWELYDDRKYTHKFWRDLYKAINQLAPDYQRMLDSMIECQNGECDECGVRRLCAMFDDMFMTLEYYNSEFKLDKEELPEDYL